MHQRYALALTIVLLGGAGAAAAQTAADPWARVPAVPKSYFADDDFLAKVDSEYAAINADIDKQAKINAALRKSFDEMDMTQKMQRMQAYMAKNPQEAMKVMQAMQAAATTTNGGVTAANNIKLLQELPVHKTNFNATLDKTLKPLQTQEEQIIKTRTIPVSEGDIGFKTPGDAAQYAALVQQGNAEYEKVCTSYFGPQGAFTTWLARYKNEVVKNMISAGEANESAIVTQLAIMDTPTGGYRSIAGLEGVRDYLEKVKDVYSQRRHEKGR